jgi:hypothetical protein
LISKSSSRDVWSSAPYLVVNLHRTHDPPHPYADFIHYTGAALRSVELCDTRGLPDLISHFADLCPNLEALRVPRDVLISEKELSIQFSRLLPRLKTLEFFLAPRAYPVGPKRVHSENQYVQMVCEMFARVREPIRIIDLKFDFGPQSKQGVQHMQDHILNRIRKSLEKISMPLPPDAKLLGQLFGKCKRLRSIRGLKQYTPAWRFNPTAFISGVLEALSETKVGLDISVVDENDSEHSLIEDIFHMNGDSILPVLEMLQTIPAMQIRLLDSRSLRGLLNNKNLWDIDCVDSLKTWLDVVQEHKFPFFPDLETFRGIVPWLTIIESSLDLYAFVVQTIGKPSGLDPAAFCAAFLSNPEFDPKFAPLLSDVDASVLSKETFNLFYHAGSLEALRWLLTSVDRDQAQHLLTLKAPGSYHCPISILCRAEYIDLLLEHFADKSLFQFLNPDQFVDVANRLLEQNADAKYLKLISESTGIENISADSRGKVLMFACSKGTQESFIYWLKLIQEDEVAPNLLVSSCSSRGPDLILRLQEFHPSNSNRMRIINVFRYFDSAFQNQMSETRDAQRVFESMVDFALRLGLCKWRPDQAEIEGFRDFMLNEIFLPVTAAFCGSGESAAAHILHRMIKFRGQAITGDDWSSELVNIGLDFDFSDENEENHPFCRAQLGLALGDFLRVVEDGFCGDAFLERCIDFLDEEQLNRIVGRHGKRHMSLLELFLSRNVAASFSNIMQVVAKLRKITGIEEK